jgi:predicted dehydrogenase
MTTSRRQFITSVSLLAAGYTLANPMDLKSGKENKLKVALVGTGIRGIGFWGKRVVENYPDVIEFVGLCDVNPGRLELAKSEMKIDCPVFADFEEMVRTVRPELVIVTTPDSTHHQFIIKGLEMGCDVLTEKPLTTDEVKCQAILDAEKKSGKNLIVGFNYRWNPHITKIKELLNDGAIGKITSVDFHWYLNTYHGASYFRRWHGQKEWSGSLWVHKATHHFDLLNWWLDADPSEVFAYGALEHYGHNGPFRGNNCRNCAHTQDCKFYWDILKSPYDKRLYVDNEQYDGYIRDNCLFRSEIDIYDKMSAQIKYANQAVVNYSLTTYSPYEGWKIAFNGMDGRLEAWQDIPFLEEGGFSQEALHEAEMNQVGGEEKEYKPIILYNNWTDYQKIMVGYDRKGHGGGDERLQDRIIRNPGEPDPLKHLAGLRDGAMSVLIGIAARKSIETGIPVRIEDLTDLKPQAKRI